MKTISFKAIGFIVSLLCVIGGGSAAYQQQARHQASARAAESVTVENGQSARVSNAKLIQEDFGEFSVISPTSQSASSSTYAPVEFAPATEGETPTLIYAYAEMGEYCPDGAACIMSFQSDGGNGSFVAVLDENLFWIDSAVFADGKYYICQTLMGNWGCLFGANTWQQVTRDM